MTLTDAYRIMREYGVELTTVTYLEHAGTVWFFMPSPPAGLASSIERERPAGVVFHVLPSDDLTVVVQEIAADAYARGHSENGLRVRARRRLQKWLGRQS